jgi:DNA-binding beta-propeller fold protein YncE
VHAGPGIVTLIDVATKTVKAKLDLGKNSFPEYGAISPDGRYYWITLGTGNVVVVDLETMTEVVTLETGAFSFGVRMSPDGQRAFVTTVPHSTKLLTESGAISTFLLLIGFWNPEGEIVIYDTRNFTELERVSTANSATIMAYAESEG